MSLVIPEPTSLVTVDDTCETVEAWADTCESIPQIRDAANKLAAIDEYLARTSTVGRARVAAAQRHLEVRIGVLLGPAPGQGSRTSHRDEKSLHAQQASDFRSMAGHPEAVEATIAESTDENPPSRRKVMDKIRKATARDPRRIPADVEEGMQRMRDSGEPVAAIAERFGVSQHTVMNYTEARRLSAPVAKQIEKATHTIEGLAMALETIDPEFVGSTAELVAASNRLRRAINRLSKENTANG